MMNTGALPGSEMACQDVRDLVVAQIEGCLEPAERDLLEHHLPQCPACRNEFERLHRLYERVQAFGTHAVSMTPAQEQSRWQKVKAWIAAEMASEPEPQAPARPGVAPFSDRPVPAMATAYAPPATHRKHRRFTIPAAVLAVAGCVMLALGSYSVHNAYGLLHRAGLSGVSPLLPLGGGAGVSGKGSSGRAAAVEAERTLQLFDSVPGFSLMKPQSWWAGSGPTDSAPMVVLKPNNGDGDVLSCIIMRTPRKPGESAESYLDDMQKRLGQYFGSYKEINLQSSTLGSLSGKRLEYTHGSGQSGSHALVVAAEVGDQTYAVTCRCPEEEWSAWDPVFEKVIDSFTLK